MFSENKNSPRIVMLVASLPPLPAGGAELQALKLGKELRQKGLSVIYLSPGKGKVRGERTISEMPVHFLYSLPARLFDIISTAKKKQKRAAVKIEYDDNKELTNEIAGKVGWPTTVYYTIFYWHCLVFLWFRRKQFDIIHAHTMEWSAIVAAKLGKRLKKAVVIKESTMNGFGSLKRFPSGSNLQQMIINNSQFVAMTKVIEANLVKSGVPREKILRISNGIPIAGSQQRKVSPQLPGPYVLFVGNLYQQPAKGIDLLLKAWRIVIDKHPGAILQVVGDGVTSAYLEFAERLKIKDTVHFLGKQSDLSRYYDGASLFVLPSRREGMSNALMEAMLNGLPCLATDISGSQDLISSGINGMLVPPMNIEMLASGIDYMLAHPDKAEQMGRNGRKVILEKFDIRVIADKYLSIYKTLLNKTN